MERNKESLLIHTTTAVDVKTHQDFSGTLVQAKDNLDVSLRILSDNGNCVFRADNWTAVISTSHNVHNMLDLKV